jgi:hypothetical protein
VTRPTLAHMRKDLRITRILWLPMAFSYGVFLLMFMQNIWVYLATGACLTFVAAATALGIDDWYQAEPLLAALPGTRGDQVAGRYLAWGVVTAAGLALFLAFTALIGDAFRGQASRLAILLSAKGAAAFLAGTILASLVFLPFHYRLGFWRGMWSFTGAGLLLSIVGLNAAARIVPDEVCALDLASPMPGAFASTARGLRALARLIAAHMGRPAVIAAAAGILAVLVLISYRLSVRFHRNRDL